MCIFLLLLWLLCNWILGLPPEQPLSSASCEGGIPSFEDLAVASQIPADQFVTMITVSRVEKVSAARLKLSAETTKPCSGTSFTKLGLLFNVNGAQQIHFCSV